MKVLNLRCVAGHGFEGWFASEAEFERQTATAELQCPLCGSPQVQRLPSAPRLNLSGARPPEAAATGATPPVPASAEAVAGVEKLQALWLQTVQQVLARTEDVGDRFTEEARKIHYGEVEERAIRGQATAEQRAELREEGIEVLSLPLPKGLDGPQH